jgi:hypothetical protein
MSRYVYTPHPHFPVGMPLIELRLANAAYRTTASALVDSGAALNILPFDIGIELGLNWEQQTFSLDLGGTLSGTQAYAVLLKAELAPFEPVDLAFAWVARSSSNVRLLLGQVNFFQVFDVHFYGQQQMFEIALHTG